ncbi:serine-protein kinase ATM-like [Asterias rubens]|uniref:serine-protein kinase ATM-like n=1 Tax=Asterias rubens TaxID=7604 RepID=UPI001455ACE2|nr:serine-protein kinase ATM-like [Asterias rubens]
MSEGLLSLQNHCDQLDSDKVTERKKHIESFKRELNRTVIVQQLDHNSNNGRGLTWNAVFNSLISYMLKEIDHLKKQKGESSTSLSSKDRKKQTVGEVFKWFVRKANQRGEKLNCSDLLHHVLTLMKDDFSGIAFGEVCCSVILKDILRSRKYFCQISSSNWQELLKYFCKALRDPVQRTSHDVLSRIVRLILAGALKQSNVSTSFILTFFNSIINKFRTSERSATVVENILGSLNLFILTCASDLRTQLCKLGEDSIDNLLHVWKKYSTPAVKEEVVVFLRMQMALHHPKGVVTEEQGAYAEDFTVWRGHLKYLYDELVYNEWTKVNTRRKLKGVIGREIFKETDVDLAADICHQILCRSDSTADDKTPGINPDLNQSSNSSRYISQGGSAAKRRKVDSSGCSWEILLDMISIQTSNLIPW